MPEVHTESNKKDSQCLQSLAEGSQSLGSRPQSKHNSGNDYCCLFTITCKIRNPRSQSFADFEQQKNNLKYSLIVKQKRTGQKTTAHKRLVSLGTLLLSNNNFYFYFHNSFL
jgi:hypothetical protein